MKIVVTLPVLMVVLVMDYVRMVSVTVTLIIKIWTAVRPIVHLIVEAMAIV